MGQKAFSKRNLSQEKILFSKEFTYPSARLDPSSFFQERLMWFSFFMISFGGLGYAFATDQGGPPVMWVIFVVVSFIGFGRAHRKALKADGHALTQKLVVTERHLLIPYFMVLEGMKHGHSHGNFLYEIELSRITNGTLYKNLRQDFQPTHRHRRLPINYLELNLEPCATFEESVKIEVYFSDMQLSEFARAWRLTVGILQINPNSIFTAQKA